MSFGKGLKSGLCGKELRVIDYQMNEFHFLPNNKFLDWSKFKELADNKINVIEKLKFILGMIENIVGKGENAGYQHFLLFQQFFQKASFPGSLKAGIVMYRLNATDPKAYQHFG